MRISAGCSAPGDAHSHNVATCTLWPAGGWPSHTLVRPHTTHRRPSPHERVSGHPAARKGGMLLVVQPRAHPPSALVLDDVVHTSSSHPGQGLVMGAPQSAANRALARLARRARVASTRASCWLCVPSPAHTHTHTTPEVERGCAAAPSSSLSSSPLGAGRDSDSPHV